MRPGVCDEVATWNVEGLMTLSKLDQLKAVMLRRGIGLMCLQETHVSGSPYFFSEDYLVILSGASDDQREYAGVGFLVAPWLQAAVVGYTQFSNRLASIKIRISGGQAVFISAYAPHGGYPFAERQAFYDELERFALLQKPHGPTVILGDFNARLHRRRGGENEWMGPFVFGNPDAGEDPLSNRELLMTTARSLGMCLANTFFDHPNERLVTYFGLGTKPTDDIHCKTFSLDYLVVHTFK